jgi:truncated hemoglobin YjbI
METKQCMPEAIQSPYRRLGGDQGVVRLVERFYQL